MTTLTPGLDARSRSPASTRPKILAAFSSRISTSLVKENETPRDGLVLDAENDDRSFRIPLAAVVFVT